MFDIDAAQTLNFGLVLGSNDGSAAAGPTVTKNGGGTLNLMGNSLLAGQATLNAGTLSLGGLYAGNIAVNGGRLTGTGTAAGGITANNGGTVAPGNSIGTMNVTGDVNFNAGSTYEVEVNDAGGSDRIDASGDANINAGASIDVIALPGTYSAGTTYTIINANAVNGQFGSITDNLAMFDFRAMYNVNSVQLETILATPFTDVAQTFNENTVATVLDPLSGTATGDMGTVLTAFVGLNATERQAVINQVSGEIHGTLGILSLQNGTQLFQELGRQLRGDSPATAGNTSLARAQSPEMIVRAQNGCCGWGAFATGYGRWGTGSTDGNATGFEYGSGGQLIGLHYWLDSDRVVGAYVGQSQFHLETSTPGQTANVDGFQSGFYLRSGLVSDYLLLSSGFAYDDYETQRRINAGGISRTANGNYLGAQAALYAERGASWCFAGGQVQPLAALQYIYNYQEDFTETGAAALNLNVDSINVHSLRSLVGSRFSRHWCTAGGWLADASVRGFWMHEYADDHARFSAQFQGGGGAFAPRGLNLGRDWALLGTGVSLRPNEAVNLYVNYDAQLGARHALHSGSGGIALAW